LTGIHEATIHFIIQLALPVNHFAEHLSSLKIEDLVSLGYKTHLLKWPIPDPSIVKGSALQFAIIHPHNFTNKTVL
jgi:hypothetical protein